MIDPLAFWNQLAAWSQATFGTDSFRGPTGPLKHLVKEVNDELLPLTCNGEHADVEEYGDLIFLAFDACRRDGYTYNQLWDAIEKKLGINRIRTWPEPSKDKPSEHVR